MDLKNVEEVMVSVVSGEQRIAPRVEMSLSVTALIAGARVPCHIKNLSDTGAFLEINKDCELPISHKCIQSKVAFVIDSHFQTISNSFYGKIVRLCKAEAKRYIAVQFVSPINVI